jgi:hypothetical protein
LNPIFRDQDFTRHRFRKYEKLSVNSSFSSEQLNGEIRIVTMVMASALVVSGDGQSSYWNERSYAYYLLCSLDKRVLMAHFIGLGYVL